MGAHIGKAVFSHDIQIYPCNSGGILDMKKKKFTKLRNIPESQDHHTVGKETTSRNIYAVHFIVTFCFILGICKLSGKDDFY